VATHKTTISIDEQLFAQAEALARQLHVPRSELYSRALREFLEEHENRALLERLDAVHGSAEPDQDDAHLRAGMRRAYARGVTSDW
jgi:Arc/MetJ family transcription regulator